MVADREVSADSSSDPLLRTPSALIPKLLVIGSVGFLSACLGLLVCIYTPNMTTSKYVCLLVCGLLNSACRDVKA